jgi:putative component of membrane protein insertase Oxa1/YidC/SpoIIIJ protein YidD
MAKWIFAPLFFFSGLVNAQTNVSERTVAAAMHQLSPGELSHRRVLLKANKHGRLNPVHYVAAALLYVYQNLLSEQFGSDCMFETSCSEFTKRSISEKGLIRGTLEGFNQISECQRGTLFEHPRVAVNPEKKIINRSNDEVQ